MEDIDLYNLSLRIPTNFFSPKIKVPRDCIKPLPKDRPKLAMFRATLKFSLRTFTKEQADEFTTYMQDRPVAEAVKTLYEKMLDYCNWFKSLPSDYPTFLPLPKDEDKDVISFDPLYYRDCLELYYTFCRWRDIIAKYMPSIVETTTGSTEEETQSDSTEEETQTDSEPNDTAASTARKGRRSKPFEEMLVGTDEQKLRTRKRLHELMNGKSGKDAMRFINAAIKEGLLLSTVTPKALTTEFEGIGGEPNCRKYKHLDEYTQEELEAAIKRLTQD